MFAWPSHWYTYGIRQKVPGLSESESKSDSRKQKPSATYTRLSAACLRRLEYYKRANVGRRREAQLSFLNDDSIQDFELILTTEQNIMDIDGKPVAHQHAQWAIIKPTLVRDDTVIQSFRSHLYPQENTISTSQHPFVWHYSKALEDSNTENPGGLSLCPERSIGGTWTLRRQTNP